MTYVVFSGGKRFDLVNPQPWLIDFEDLALGMSRRLRYGPLMSIVQWTVAQHTVLGMALCPAEARPYFALHDAGEHIHGDDITPKKQALLQLGRTPEEGRIALEVYQRLLDRTDEAIHLRAGLKWPVPHDIEVEVKLADRRAYNAEVTHLMPNNVRDSFVLFDVPPVERDLVRRAAQLDAHQLLLDEFRKLPRFVLAEERPFQCVKHVNLCGTFRFT